MQELVEPRSGMASRTLVLEGIISVTFPIWALLQNPDDIRSMFGPWSWREYFALIPLALLALMFAWGSWAWITGLRAMKQHEAEGAQPLIFASILTLILLIYALAGGELSSAIAIGMMAGAIVGLISSK